MQTNLALVGFRHLVARAQHFDQNLIGAKSICQRASSCHACLVPPYILHARKCSFMLIDSGKPSFRRVEFDLRAAERVTNASGPSKLLRTSSSIRLLFTARPSKIPPVRVGFHSSERLQHNRYKRITGNNLPPLPLDDLNRVVDALRSSLKAMQPSGPILFPFKSIACTCGFARKACCESQVVCHVLRTCARKRAP